MINASISNTSQQNTNLKHHITTAGLSARSENALQRAGIHWIEDLLETDAQSIKNVKNIGITIFNEIWTFVSKCSYMGEIPNFMKTETNTTEESVIPTFRDAEGVLLEDVLLTDLDLPVRGFNILIKKGLHYASETIGKEKELLNERNVGKTAILESEQILKTLQYRKADDSKTNKTCLDFVMATCIDLPIHKGELYQELLPLFEKEDFCDGVAMNYHKAFANKRLRNAIKGKITNFVAMSIPTVTRNAVFSLFEGNVYQQKTISKIIDELVLKNELIETEGMLKSCRQTLSDYIHNIPDFKTRSIMDGFISGVALTKIGESYRAERHKIADIIKNELRQMPPVMEDKYLPFFEKYIISEDDFAKVFNGAKETYKYLFAKCIKQGSLPLSTALLDESAPDTIKDKIRDLINKGLRNSDFKKTSLYNEDAAIYVLRKHFQNKGSYNNFIAKYNAFLEENQLTNVKRLKIHAGSFHTTLRNYNNILWSRGRMLRYYNLDSYDFEKLWEELNLQQYKNQQTSTSDLFATHKALMAEYDIRDGYELHSLLRHLCKKESRQNIRFGRVPTMVC